MNSHADDDKIREGIKKVARRQRVGHFQCVEGVVTAVDWPNRACTVLTDEGIEIDQIRLREPNGDDDLVSGWVCQPTIGSAVVVAEVYDQPLNGYIAMFSELDAIVLCDGNGNEKLNINLADGTITMNGGNNGGTGIIADMVTRWNNIENDSNNLKIALNGWEPTGVWANDAITLKAVFTGWAANALQLTAAAQIEDNNVTH